MNQIPLIKQAYLSLIPVMPLGYIILHSWREDKFMSKLYVTRSCLPPTANLKQLVESEMDQLDDVRHPKLRVALTNELEPKVYGGFFLSCGAEVQFPLRVAIDDVEQARRLGSNLEMDLGLAKYRRKVEVNSSVGDELISRLMLSDNAKRFVIQRQLQLANNGTYFCIPMFAWSGIVAASYPIFTGMMRAIGGVASFACSALIAVVVYSQFLKQFKSHVTKKADEKTIEKGPEYFFGARDYFDSSMKFNKIMRKILGGEGEKNIEKNGDLKTDPVAYSERKWNAESTEWLQTKWGRRARIGLLAGTIISYPLVSLAVNGPLVKLTFPRRYSVEDLPEYLKKIADEEYERFLEKESRVPRDAVVIEHLNNNINDHDTVASGSLGVRTGLHLAVPFFARFSSKEEVIQYFREKQMNWISFLDERLPVDWDTPTGEELAETLVMSDGARRFLFLRDLYAHDGYAALAQRSISWASWTTFSGIFTYWLHGTAKIFGASAFSFLGIYGVLLTGAWYANRHWHYLYRYITDVYADSTSAKSSFAHSEGGKEYYWKELKRNRLLRELHPHLYTKVKVSGDIRGIPTPIIIRYDHLKDVKEEDDELRQVVGGDDF